jgi:hypothetical protein
MDIGHTFEKRPLLVARISKKTGPAGLNKRAVFIEAGDLSMT